MIEVKNKIQEFRLIESMNSLNLNTNNIRLNSGYQYRCWNCGHVTPLSVLDLRSETISCPLCYRTYTRPVFEIRKDKNG